VPTIPTSLGSSGAAKAQSLQLLPNLLPTEASNNTAGPDTDRFCAGEEATICRIPGNSLALIEHTDPGGDGRHGGEEGEEGQIYADSDPGSLDSVTSSYGCHLSALVDGPIAKHSTPERPRLRSSRHRRQQRWSQERRNQASTPLGLADLASRITDWIPPPPELPLSPKLLDPAIAAAYPLPSSRACSEPTPSTHQPPYQLPPYPAVPRSTASSSSSVRGARLRKMPRPKVSLSPASSGTTDITWGPDSPPTSALRLRRAAATSALPPSSPTHTVSSRDSGSTRVTGVEAELGALEEMGRKEVIRQRILLWRLIAERGNGNEKVVST